MDAATPACAAAAAVPKRNRRRFTRLIAIFLLHDLALPLNWRGVIAGTAPVYMLQLASSGR
jgi:hypothetical protein